MRILLPPPKIKTGIFFSSRKFQRFQNFLFIFRLAKKPRRTADFQGGIFRQWNIFLKFHIQNTRYQILNTRYKFFHHFPNISRAHGDDEVFSADFVAQKFNGFGNGRNIFDVAVIFFRELHQIFRMHSALDFAGAAVNIEEQSPGRRLRNFGRIRKGELLSA